MTMTFQNFFKSKITIFGLKVVKSGKNFETFQSLLLGNMKNYSNIVLHISDWLKYWTNVLMTFFLKRTKDYTYLKVVLSLAS